MNLTPELVDHADKEIQIKSLLVDADIVTAQHILFKQFVDGTKWKGLPKIIFYILLTNNYGPPFLKDDEGRLGYKLKLKTE